MVSVLVTGGAGFIGSNLVPRLLENKHSVVVLDNLYSGRLENLNSVRDNPGFTFIQGDIRDPAALNKAMQGVDSIVHLAALIDVSASVTDPYLTHDVNVTGTLNVLHSAVKSGIRKLVFASSTAVYGDVKALPVNEATVLKPISPYAASKAACEAYCNAFTGCYGIETIALRFFNVYGPRNENSPYSGVITKFLRKALNDEALTIEGDGEQTRDFIHVNDVAQAIVLALECKGVSSGAFNVCTGLPTSINTLVSSLQIATNKKLKTVHAPARIGDIKYSYGDPTKAKQQLNFQSNIDLVTGLKLLLKNVA